MIPELDRFRHAKEGIPRASGGDPTLYGWETNEPTPEEIRESNLIDMFYLLNEEAQEMLLTHAEGLVATGKYKKDSSLGLLEKYA